MKKPFQIQTQMLESVWAEIMGRDKAMGTGGITRQVIRLTGAIYMLLSLCMFFLISITANKST